MISEIETTDQLRLGLEKQLNLLINKIGLLKIGVASQFPYGWRKAAKGRTVWRIVEELITQNLEKYHMEYGMSFMQPSDSEVSVYDFVCKLNGYEDKLFVNIKGANIERSVSKDDISKANELKRFYEEDKNRKLFIATFLMKFESNLTVNLNKCCVIPISWIPDVYVNPSNNGNLQSSKYKDVETAIKRKNCDFIKILAKEHLIAIKKRNKNIT